MQLPPSFQVLKKEKKDRVGWLGGGGALWQIHFLFRKDQIVFMYLEWGDSCLSRLTIDSAI
jgi:hypothetical protein